MSQRYFIKISFEGTRYNGWQIQKNSAQTVQQKINDGLSRLLNEKIEVTGCCRTDTGVHAKELYAHFDSKRNDLSTVPSSIAPVGNAISKQGGRGTESTVDWLHKFNSMLPVDISIDGIFSVTQNANARFDASARTYQYFIHNVRNPFLVNRSYFYYGELDIARMNKAAGLLKKNTDFSAFSKMNTQVKTNSCKIYQAEWTVLPRLDPPRFLRLLPTAVPEEEREGYRFTIRADRFLHGMVRMVVGTMILVGKHKITLSDFKEIIDSKDCRNAGAVIPACGLYLARVEYSKKIFIQ